MRRLTQKDVTPGVKSAVNAYLMARAFAETRRDQVDKIEREILAEAPLTNGFYETEGRRNHKEAGELITDPKDTWLCTNEAQLEEYYLECDNRARKAGLKPDDMPTTHCPALVAERIQTETEWLICDNATTMLGLEFDGKELNHRLLCMGIEKYQEFIDLIVKLVVNLPDFKSPLAKIA